MVVATRSRFKQNAYWTRPRLPSEVLLMVFEQLLDDIPSLSSCCLVSRSWLPLGRIYLFRKMTIHTKKGGPDNFSVFLSFLQHSDTGRHVRELTLSAPPLGFDPVETTPLNEDSDKLVYSLCTPCSIDTMLRMLHYTCNLRELNLSYLLFTAASTAPETLSMRRPALDYLWITNCSASGKDPRLFYELLCIFSDIGTLWFTCGPWEPVVASTLFDERTTCPLIRELDMYGEYQATTDGTFELLRRSGSLGGALTQIRFETSCPTILTSFFAFLPEAATHLVKLNLNAVNVLCEHPDGTPYPLRFPLFPALRRLTFEIEIYAEDKLSERSEYVRNTVNVYAQLLSHPSSFPALRTFDLCISNGPLVPETFSHSARSTDAWQRFGEALVALPALHRVNFELGDIPDQAGATSPREDQLPEHLIGPFLMQCVPELWQWHRRLLDRGPVRVDWDERRRKSTGGIRVFARPTSV